MNQIALLDLQQRTSEILDEVRQKHEDYVVTDQGQPIARLSPITTEAQQDISISAQEKAWTRYAEAIDEAHQAQSKAWRTQDLLEEIRRT